MVIDTSALVAILTGEPERAQFIAALEAADRRCLSAGAEVVPVDSDQAAVARRAYSRFGEGRHQAALNFGDCFAYALAMTRAEPLLFKGKGFIHTDIIPAELADRWASPLSASPAAHPPIGRARRAWLSPSLRAPVRA